MSTIKEVKIIGITGGSASGKTSIATKIDEVFSETKSVIIIKLDDYYQNLDHLTMEERQKVNFDHPDAFDLELLYQHLAQLKKGLPIEKPTYDFVQHTRSDVVEKINPVDVIILEGLFVLQNQQLRDICDIKIFVDTDSDIRFIRRLTRDVKKRGRSVDSVITQYLTTVKSMHDAFVEPSKRFADIIIPEGGKNMIAINLIINQITSLIKGEQNV